MQTSDASRLHTGSPLISSSRTASLPTVAILGALLATLLVTPSARAQLVADVIHEGVSVSLVDDVQAGKQRVAEWHASAPMREYNGFAIQGFSTLDELTGSVRFATPDGWSEWHPLYVVRSATDDAFLAGYHGSDIYRGAEIEIHFEGSGAKSPYILAAGVFDTRLDEDSDDTSIDAMSAGKQNGASGASDVVDVIPPTLVTRAEWNAAPFIGTPSPLGFSNPPPFRYITFHHAAGFRATTLEEGIAQVKAIQDFHQNGRGWSDIGYQFVVDRGGHVFQGRPFRDGSTTLEEIPALSLGAHAGGANTGNIGICLLGCYHPPEGPGCQDVITDEALDSYISMYAFLSEAYNIPLTTASVQGHRDFGSTSCPGDNIYALLPEIQERAIELQQFGSDTPDDFFIEQNAPNPFRGQTDVRYYLQEDGMVNVVVYNLAGQAVAELVSEFQEGPRWYRTTFDASSLPSGMYFYQVRVEGFAGEIFNGSRTLVHVK